METKTLNKKPTDNFICEDITKQRTYPEVRSVACHIIPDMAILDQKNDIVDYRIVKTHLFNEGKLSRNQILKILSDSKKILDKENNVVRIDKKCNIVGDIHGQFYDLLGILNSFDLSKDTLIFLGDYVDRGAFGIESYIYLMTLKCHFPNNIYILRGNHESERMTQYFSFKAECIHKYDDEIYQAFVESFMYLPLVGVIQSKLYCSHGGISKDIKYLEQIEDINRKVEVPYTGPMCDILWSDPNANYEKGHSWSRNQERRCSYKYNFQNVIEFLENNKLKGIIRAHEVQEKGYRTYKEYNKFPTVTTIFSCPNYCDVYNNLGAIAEYDNEKMICYTFDAEDHPYVLPGYLDGISWSFPFLSEKLYEFATVLFKELKLDEQIEGTDNMAAKIAVMRAERECIDEFEDEESTVDCQAIGVSDEGDLDFEMAKEKDAINEEMKLYTPDVSITTEIPPSGAQKIHKTISENKDLINMIDNVKISKNSTIEKIEIDKPSLWDKVKNMFKKKDDEN